MPVARVRSIGYHRFPGGIVEKRQWINHDGRSRHEPHDLKDNPVWAQ
jgi:hypothetical protein